MKKSYVLTDTLSEDQRHSIVSNSHHVQFWNQIVPALCDYVCKDQCDLYFSNLKHPACNGVVFTHLLEEKINEKIRSISQIFQAKQLPFFWMVKEDSEPSNLSDYLEENGFRFWANETGMFIDIWESNLSLILDNLSQPPNFSVSRISNPAEIDDFTQLSINLFHYPPDVRNIFEKFALESNGFEPNLYIGFFQNRPVAMCLIAFLNGVATIHNVGTLTEFQRHSFGVWMLREAFLDVIKKKYRYITVQSSDIGICLYKKMGMVPITKTKYFIY